jgi:hypothetical protein
MRLRVVILPAMLMACSPAQEKAASPSGRVFRYTTIGRSPPHDTIVLGQAWRTAAKYGARRGDSITSIPVGEFAGADSIAVHRNSAGVVIAIEYFYYASRDVPELLRGYRSTLGPPAGTSITDLMSGSTHTTAKWCDDSTEFLFTTIEPVVRDSVAGRAVLFERWPAPRTGLSPQGC